MSSPPETRPSLIRRLGDTEDANAWEEFFAIYGPLVYRFARRKGFQHADAENIVQDVMVAVGKAVDSWEPNPRRGRFRTWLFRIARNLMINFLVRPKYQLKGSGDTRVMKWIEEQPDCSLEETEAFEHEYRKEVFRWAASRVKQSVSQNHWNAFWLSSVEGLPIAELATKLGISVGAIYIARSRIIVKIKEQVARFDEGTHSSELDTRNTAPHADTTTTLP